MSTVIIGIYQGDLILQSALQNAFADVRRNPWLLDFAFAGLPEDGDTAAAQGQSVLDQAKKWFLKTNVRVVVGPVLDAALLPAIGVMLVGEQEDERAATLADVHYQPTEDADVGRPALWGPFAAAAYDPASGTVTLPASVGIVLVPGMSMMDDLNVEHPIVQVLSDTQFQIEPGANCPMKNATIVGSPASYVTSIESSVERQTYQLAVRTAGEPSHMVWLHSIAKFCLLMFKQRYLEARGFERSTFQSTDLRPDASMGVENSLVRFMNVTGYVRNSWPKEVAPKITSVVFQPRISGGLRMASSAADLENLPFLGDQDPDSVPQFGGTTATYLNPIAGPGSPFVFYGNATPPPEADACFVENLPSEVRAASRALYFGVSVGTYEYAWIALPSSFGTPTSFSDADKDKALRFTRVQQSLPVYDAGSGQTIGYDVWRSDSPGLGSLTVRVQ